MADGAAKTSAMILYEDRERAMKQRLLTGMDCAHPGTEDFTGKVDGKGVKGVMKSPKSNVHMIDPMFTLGIGDVLTYGANKYAANNWMRGMAWSEVFGGVCRHLLQWFCGQDRDVESGLPHLHHAACGIMFLSYYSRKDAYSAFDDRMFK